MSASRIGVTGANGLLGSTLLRVIQSATALESDIRDKAGIQNIISQMPDLSHIIHTAAMTNVGACEKDPNAAFAVNAEGTKNVVEAAKSRSIPIIYISTASVFSGNTGNYTEDETPEPRGIYNQSKVKGEQYVAAYEKGVIVRLNLIGVHPDGSRGRNFMEWLVDSIRANADMNVFDDVYINPLSNWTIAETLKILVEKPSLPNILHLCSSDVLSKADIAEMVIARLRYSGILTRSSVDGISDGVVRPKKMWINGNRTNELLGIAMPVLQHEINTILSPLSI